EYARKVREHFLRGEHRPDRCAFEQVTGDRPYFSAPGFDNTPYVCIRIPTGGGKTLLAAHAVGEIGRALLETDQPACLWITPSTTIREPTLRALQNPTHPCRLALEESLGNSVQVATLEEALLSPQLVRPTSPLVIVTTIQSYRIADEEGRELAAARRIYRD